MKKLIKGILELLYFKPLRAIQRKNREKRNKELRKKLINKNPTLIGDNCNVGVMYHDLGLQFTSPTINLYIFPDDYIKFLTRLKYYTTHDIVEIFEEGVDYPIGLIDDIKVYFMHYHSFEEAKEKWIERCRRMDLDNLFITMTKRSFRCTEEHIKAFDKLPYKNKVIFLNTPHPEIKSSFYIKGFEKKDGCGVLLDYEHPTYKAKRYFDRMDYVEFLNTGVIKENEK